MCSTRIVRCLCLRVNPAPRDPRRLARQSVLYSGEESVYGHVGERSIVRVTCNQEEFHRALGIVGRAVASKSTLPVLGNFLLEASDGGLTISATNLDFGISCTIPATTTAPGKVTLHARVLSEFVGVLLPGTVELRQEQQPLTVLVESGHSRAHLRGIDPDEFPPLAPANVEGPSVRLEPTALREAISQVVFAAASDDSRPVLAGVQFTARDGEVTMAAADGFRMSLRTLTIEDDPSMPISIIVPARAMNELQRVLADVSDQVELRVTPNGSQIVITAPNLMFTSRLIDGAFPDLRQVVPKDWNTRVVVLREQLLDATRRALIFARSSNDVVKIEVTPPGEALDMGRMAVTATAADTGDNRDEVDAQVEGGEMQIAFNGRYLHDVLSVIRSPSVALELQGPNSAGVIRPVGSDNFTHVIMPMVIGA